MTAAYYAALDKCVDRYCAGGDFEFFREGVRDRLPIPKLCRWLGYVQGVLIERGWSTVQAERDWTRPLFRPLDFPENPDATREEIAEILEQIAKEGMPHPRHLDAALDAILTITGRL